MCHWSACLGRFVRIFLERVAQGRRPSSSVGWHFPMDSLDLWRGLRWTSNISILNSLLGGECADALILHGQQLQLFNVDWRPETFQKPSSLSGRLGRLRHPGLWTAWAALRFLGSAMGSWLCWTIQPLACNWMVPISE